MNCINPIYTWQSAKLDDNGRRLPVYTMREAFVDLPKVPVPCRKCAACKMIRRNMMAVRIMHEASMHRHNAIIHLTFDDDHVGDGVLCVDDGKRFRKRLRECLGYKPRLLMVGEYGSQTHRKHYHGCLFGDDLLGGSREFKKGKFSSPLLERAWDFGRCEVGLMGLDGAKYISKYIVEDVGIDARVVWPRNPALGYGWVAKYHDEIVRTGKIIFDGQEHVIPRQYMEWFPDEFAELKSKRMDFVATEAMLPRAERERRAESKWLNKCARNALRPQKSTL